MANENVNEEENDQPHLLIEGPRWGDAQFYGGWLLQAAKANEIWVEAKKEPAFAKEIETFQLCYPLDFGKMAGVLLGMFLGQKSTLVVSLETVYPVAVAVMAAMGFFVLTGERYQMTMPTELDLPTVKRAVLALVETEDSEFMFHPERMLVAMSCSSALAWQQRLGEMNEDLRVADRRLLLDNWAVQSREN